MIYDNDLGKLQLSLRFTIQVPEGMIKLHVVRVPACLRFEYAFNYFLCSKH
jgi:hypothetical protein